MNSEQLNEILMVLRERMNFSSSVDEFDRMLEARNTLQQWASEGFQGEIPFAEELRGWNIELPPAAPTEADVAEIVRDLRNLLMQDHAEWPAIQVAYGKVRRWQNEGMNGPLPKAEQLARWGVWADDAAPVAASSVVKPAKNALPKQDVAPVPPSSPVTLHHDESKIGYDLQYRYEDAVADLQEGHYYLAGKALQALQSEASGALAQQIHSAYQEANKKLQAQTRDLIGEARRTQREDGGLAQQREAWLAVLKVNPESKDANQALSALARNQAEQEIASQLSEVRVRAESAAKNDQLPELNKLFGQVGVWKALGEKTPPEISDSLYQQVADLEQHISHLRNKTRRRLSESSTLLSGGDYREAYRRGRELFERAVPRMVDFAGHFGITGGEVDTGEFFRKARELFVSSLQSLAQARFTQAEGEEKQEPEKAMETLKNAEEILTDTVLSTDDREELKPLLDKVLDKQQDVQRRINKYNKAKEKVIQANRAAIRVEAFALYQEAKEEYPDYPNLETLIERALGDVAEVVATEVAAAIANARRQMQRERYEQALQTLAKARTEAIRQVARAKPDSGLAKRLAEVEALEDEIADAEGELVNMMALLKKVDEAIERFDQDEARGLRLARNLLQQLNEKERKHNEVRQRLATLQDRQSAMDNWELGQAEYRQRNWQTAQEIFRQVANGNSKYAPEAGKLADRALACQYADDAQRAELRFDWLTAHSNYQQAESLLQKVGTDSLTASILKQCQDALQRFAPLQESDERVRELISQATSFYQMAQQRAKARRSLHQQVEPIGEFGQALRILQEASDERSTMAEKVNDLLREVQSSWREVYLGAMKAALTSSQADIALKALALAEELRDANLIYESHEEELVHHLMLKALDNEHEQLMRQIPTPWAEIESNRKKRVTLLNQCARFNSAASDEMQEANDAYREAGHQRILHQVYDLKQQGKTDAAKEYLLQALQEPILRGNQRLLLILMELYWESEAWNEAEHFARRLTHQAEELADVCRGLTQAARWFKAGLVPLARAEIEVIRQRYIHNSTLLEVIADKEKQFLYQVRDQSLHEAGAAFTQHTDEGYLEAIVNYAQASEVAPDDTRIFIGFQDLSYRVESPIRQLCTQAKALLIGQRPLTEAIQELEQMLHQLTIIHQAAEPLQLSVELKEELAETLKQVNSKRHGWKVVQTFLHKAKIARDNALQQPLPPSNPLFYASGWNFNEASAYLRAAQREARRAFAQPTSQSKPRQLVQSALDALSSEEVDLKTARKHLVQALQRSKELAADNECWQLVQSAQDALMKLEEQARMLEEHIQAFMQALYAEAFDDVIQEADKLARLWQKACQQAPWGGLNHFIKHHYIWFGRDVETLEEHKQLATEQKDNLQEWIRWREASEKSYQETRKRGQTLSRNSLDDLRYEYPLTEVMTLCRECIEHSEKFDELLDNTPETKPLSQKAEDARDRIVSTNWEHEVLGRYGYRNRAIRVHEEAEAELARLNSPDGPLAKLKQIIETQINPFLEKRRSIPPQNLNMAENALEKCERIDPNNKEIRRYREQMEQWYRRGPSG